MGYRTTDQSNCSQEKRIGGGVAFYLHNNIMYDVIGFEAEQERLIANVKSDESNTRNFCVV